MSTFAAEKNQARHDGAYQDFVAKRRRIWDSSARYPRGYYHRRLGEIYRSLIPPGTHVLDLGCGNGDLLAAVEPVRGVGVDFSGEAVAFAREKHPHLDFVLHDVNALGSLVIETDAPFDFIILSELVNELWDVQATLVQCQRFCHAKTRILLTGYSRLWQPILSLARALGLARKVPELSWITPEDLENFLELADLELLRSSAEILLPVPLPILTTIANRYLVKLPIFRAFALTNIYVARPRQSTSPEKKRPSVSVVVAARNEAGNIDRILKETPELGSETELIFVEGGSTDDTYEVIKQAIPRYPHRSVRLMRQEGRGKGDAVRLGFREARGDVLMILDADLTVPPTSLPAFYDALVSNKGEFINGVRLVYPMEDRAMRFFNIVGNKFFSMAFSFLLGQTLKDSLCGTKVLFREDYDRISDNRSYFGEFDPFGDFDLLFGAAKLNLKIVDLPVRYRERTYGDTNIQRWRHGWMLLKMVVFAARRIKFI